MARLPIPGRDDDVWGEVLNEFLRVGHGEEGATRTPYVDARRYPHLKAAADAIGEREETLLIAAPLSLAASALTVPGNITLEFSATVRSSSEKVNPSPSLALLWRGCGRFSTSEDRGKSCLGHFPAGLPAVVRRYR